MLRPGEIVIDDGTSTDVTHGGGVSRGLVPRDYSTHPAGYLAGAPAMRAVAIPLIPRSEWSARIKEMADTKSRLSDIRLQGNAGQPIPSLDQNYGDGVRWGFCWAHNPTHAAMLLRAVNNQRYVPLSAFAVACVIKGGRNEGGWGALALEWIMAHGVPDQRFWPQKDDRMFHDTPAMRENAALHKVTEGWVDLDAAVYDRTLTFDQTMTLLLNRVPVCADYNWWGHSVCLLDPVEVEPGAFGVRLWNSWADTWGDRGMGVLQGQKAVPDGAVAPRVVLDSAS